VEKNSQVSEEQAQKDLLAAFIGETGRSDDDQDDEEKAFVDPEGLTIEQRVRKERPPSRIRFAESAQPDYVMMALEGVGLMYGNQVSSLI
jgi:hypothetical protein